MQTLDYPKGFQMHTGFYHDGKFYVVLTNQTRDMRWSGVTGKWRLMSFCGTVDREVNGEGHRPPLFFPHADHEGVNIGRVTNSHSVAAVNAVSGEKFVAITKVPEDTGYWGQRDWLQKNLGLLTHERYQNVRAVWNDSLVVMTGQEAASRASMVMGPTAAANVLATKGLDTGYVVAYQRGGSHRILKMSRRSVTHLALADDGLVFMCCTTGHGAFLFDFDVQ